MAVVWGFARMWRAWTVLIPVVIANALIQALLVWPSLGMRDGAVAVMAAILSAIGFLVSFGLVASCALQVPTGRVSWGDAGRALRPHIARYVVWAVVLGVAVVIGLALWTIPGLVILAITPFLLLAAIDGEPNPLMTNFRVIARHFGSSLVTALIAGLVLLLGNLLAGVTAFFVRGSLASFVVWTVAGLVVAWFTTAWALIYRRAPDPAGGAEEPPGEAPGSPEVDADEAPTYP